MLVAPVLRDALFRKASRRACFHAAQIYYSFALAAVARWLAGRSVVVFYSFINGRSSTLGVSQKERERSLPSVYWPPAGKRGRPGYWLMPICRLGSACASGPLRAIARTFGPSSRVRNVESASIYIHIYFYVCIYTRIRRGSSSKKRGRLATR